MIQLPTIYALSSGQGRAGIAVVRVSGTLAEHVLCRFAGKLPKPREAVVRKLKSHEGLVIDQAMVLWLPGPATVTGEDMVEFHLHGSPAIIEVLFREFALIGGLRPAVAGEFTKRAFDNGKLDLVEVEGLADVLSANDEAQRRLAMRQFLGETSAVYHKWRADIISALALFEASIDFVEEDDVSAQARNLALPVIMRLRGELETALVSSSQNASIRNGLKVVIAGAPNVGKSSLLNALAKRDAAIVSAVAGTTRDVVEAHIMFEGVALTLADTAGMRFETSDEIEKIGIDRAQAAVTNSDILIWVRALDVLETVGPSRTPDIMIANKSDLDSIRERNDGMIAVSTKTGLGLSELRDALMNLIHARMSGVENAVVVRQRHVVAVQETIRLLNNSIEDANRPLELVTEDLRNAARALSSITGHVDVEDLLTKIFSEFCIGK
jgi:tRNA modification GTPase